MNRSLTFFEAILAVVIGMMLYDWLKTLKADPEIKSWLQPLFWIGLIGFVVISALIEEWRDKIWWKERDRKEQEFVREQGYESWAEYMVDHGEGEDVRESWRKKAAEEKTKREKRYGKK
jgi:hypothetical protein